MEQPHDPHPESGPSDAPPADGDATDIRALVERVYRLMLADARIERARGVPTPRQRS